MKEPWEMTKREYRAATVLYRDKWGHHKARTPDGVEHDIREPEAPLARKSSIDFAMRYHRFAIAAAIDKGKTIPRDVLRDYPEYRDSAKPASVSKSLPRGGDQNAAIHAWYDDTEDERKSHDRLDYRRETRISGRSKVFPLR